MAYWLLKTEPDCYSYDDLERDGKTVWDGVANNLALKYLRQVRKGDRAIIYHTGEERQAVGIAEVLCDPYVDPLSGNPARAVVDVRALRRLARPVTLAEIKADRSFADFLLVKMARLSVMPVSDDQWAKIVGT